MRASLLLGIILVAGCVVPERADEEPAAFSPEAHRPSVAQGIEKGALVTYRDRMAPHVAALEASGARLNATLAQLQDGALAPTDAAARVAQERASLAPRHERLAAFEPAPEHAAAHARLVEAYARSLLGLDAASTCLGGGISLDVVRACRQAPTHVAAARAALDAYEAVGA